MPRPAPAGVLVADDTSALPVALRRFGAAQELGPRLEYPPNGSTVDLLPGGRSGFAPVTLRAEGGQGELRWIINGVPQAAAAGEFEYVPDGPGFVQVEVIDAQDRASRASFRLEWDG